MSMINENTDAVFDGRNWYYDIKPGSICVDESSNVVSFSIYWRHGSRGEIGVRRITLALDCVKGARERATV